MKSIPGTTPSVASHAALARPLGRQERTLELANTRMQNAADLDQKAVAHHLEDAPAMLGHSGIEEFAAMLAKRTERAFFIGPMSQL